MANRPSNPRRPKLNMRKVAKKRTAYTVRSGLSSGAAGSLLAAVNGRGEVHWGHDTIRQAAQQRPPTNGVPILHPNIRGPRYYH